MLLLGLAGCTHSVEGKASTGGKSSASPSSSSAAAPTAGPTSPASSRFRTVDPCSFLLKNAFDRLATQVSGQVNNSEYSSCGLLITGISHGHPISWDIDIDASSYFTTPSQLGTLDQVQISSKQVGGQTVWEGQSQQEGCLRALQLPDQKVTLILSAKGKIQECPAADGVLASALHVISSKSEKQLTLAKQALGSADICAEFGPKVAPFIKSQAAGEQDGLHGCLWKNGTTTVMVQLSGATWPPTEFTSGAQKATANGHPVMSEISSRGPSVYAQGSVNYGPSATGDKRLVDQLGVIASDLQNGSAVKSGFPDLLASMAQSSLH
ncbi:MAG TPA: hypothetical protein VHC49_01950 [Mycobacteriales bacterium]|nr:hypothetical protein [Mycobacteriales bacterium]